MTLQKFNNIINTGFSEHVSSEPVQREMTDGIYEGLVTEILFKEGKFGEYFQWKIELKMPKGKLYRDAIFTSISEDDNTKNRALIITLNRIGFSEGDDFGEKMEKVMEFVNAHGLPVRVEYKTNSNTGKQYKNILDRLDANAGQ